VKVSRCACEGLSSADRNRYEDMLEVVDDCKRLGIEPPEEAVKYIEAYNLGEEESLTPLRPGIDKGVYLETINGEKVIMINLREIKKDIDLIRVKHEEFEE